MLTYRFARKRKQGRVEGPVFRAADLLGSMTPDKNWRNRCRGTVYFLCGTSYSRWDEQELEDGTVAFMMLTEVIMLFV